jgi:tetratricopeptide (TPR) repeat protein
MKSLPLLLITLCFAMTHVSAQSFNFEIASEGSAPVLLGKINKDGLLTTSYLDWFQKNYDTYQPNTAIVQHIEPELKEYTITAFMGTWCGDSKREVPRLYKILDAVAFPLDRLTMIAVSRDRDHYKQSPGGEEEGLNIHRVPTFIFYKNGKEINRIVESPVETLEADIASILNGTYTSNYHAVSLVSNLLAEVPLEKFEKKSSKILPKLISLATKYSELNTYSNVLFTSGKQEEAIAVALLNTKVFPNETSVYINLANKLHITSNLAEAQKYYEKALALDPNNEQIQTTLSTLKLSASN